LSLEGRIAVFDAVDKAPGSGAGPSRAQNAATMIGTGVLAGWQLWSLCSVIPAA